MKYNHLKKKKNLNVGFQELWRNESLLGESILTIISSSAPDSSLGSSTTQLSLGYLICSWVGVVFLVVFLTSRFFLIVADPSDWTETRRWP